jgi:hypothetical protein
MTDTLNDRIEAHLVKARAVPNHSNWYADIWLLTQPLKRISVSAHQDAIHIAANDPATIEALCAVAKDVEDYHNLERCPLCDALSDLPHFPSCPMHALYDALGKE